MATEYGTRPQYDLPTAITFLLGGVALGVILTFLFSPLSVDSAAKRLTSSQPDDTPIPAESMR